MKVLEYEERETLCYFDDHQFVMPAGSAQYGTIPILHCTDFRARKFHESKFYLAIFNC